MGLTREMRNKGAVGRDRRDDNLGTGKNELGRVAADSPTGSLNIAGGS